MFKTIINNFLFTLSTFSSIRTKYIKFNKSNVKYTYLFLPLIGLIIGVLSYLGFILLTNILNINNPIILSLLMIVFNIVFTGGIHYDGYLDSLDAFKSYREKNEKLVIIKDSRIGAFSLIYFLVAIILLFCASYYIIMANYIIMFVIVPVISRVLLLFLIVINKLEKDDMLSLLYNPVFKSKYLTVSFFYVTITAFVFFNWYLIILWISGIIYLLYYNQSFKKHFDFLNGDLCGYFIITCEILTLLVFACLIQIT